MVSRGENGELRVGVRRAMRQQSNVPSSVISSHSMHLGVLATAWHAVSTGTMFTVYYKPRYMIEMHFKLSFVCKFIFRTIPYGCNNFVFSFVTFMHVLLLLGCCL